VSEIKDEKPLAGSTTTAQASKKSSKSMSDGEESVDMLLALLYSPLATLIKQNKAVVGSANYKGTPSAVIILPNVEPTENGLLWLSDLEDDV